jgi:hypothetical protein
VIFGEQSSKYLKFKNDGALPTKIYVKNNNGETIPFINQEELQNKIESRQK